MTSRTAVGNLTAWLMMLIANLARLLLTAETGLGAWVQIAIVVSSMTGVALAVTTLRDVRARANIHKELRRARAMSMRGR